MVECRLPDTGEHRLAGALIDRGARIGFRLNGREIPAFEGDTVLSALMAAGWYGFAEHDESGLQLTPASPLFVALGPAGDGPRDLIHAARLPVSDGLVLEALAPLSAEPRFVLPFRKPPDTLRSLDQPPTGPEPGDAVRLAATSRSETADLVVVGGGIAGMAAAAAASRRGLSVRLFERQGRLGGIAEYFGRAEGERAAEDVVAELAAELSAAENVVAHTFAEVATAGDGAAVALVTERAEYGAPAVARITVKAPSIVLATGVREKLPLFSGNRAIGVLPSLEAWQLASDYGVWHGETAQLATAASEAYRLALSLADAGITITRIYDARPDPASRYIAFAKAYGMRLSLGTRIARVERDDLADPLTVHGFVEVAEGSATAMTRETDSLIISAGLQPELTLWLQAGGSVRWNAERQALLPDGASEGMALAGAAAGYRTLAGCLESGGAAVARVLGERPPPIEEAFIDPAFESPDGAWPVALPVPGEALPGYFDGGPGLHPLPFEAEPRGLVGRLFGNRGGDADEMAALSILAAAAKVAAGDYAPETVADAAAERIVEDRTLRQESLGFVVKPPPARDVAPDARDWTMPAWLQGRFGADAALFLLAPDDDRAVEPGRLIFATSDLSQPEDAIGVALGAAASEPGRTVVLASASAVEPGQAVSIADLGQRARGLLVRRLGDD